MKVILVPVSDRPECALALHHGFILSQKIKSNMMGCHIRPHSDSEINLPDESEGSILPIDSYDLAWEATLKERSQDDDHIKAQMLFKNMAMQFNYKLSKTPKASLNAMWTERVGSPETLFAIMGPVSDLIIVSRALKKGDSLARNFMFNAIVNSSAPVLVLPQENIESVGQRICIAWNQSTEAAHAIKAAMPLLIKADEVNIITSGPENRLGPKAKHVKKYLQNWNVNSNCLSIKAKNTKKAILKGYKDTSSDLLVMGGYSRSRLRQRMFGGVTEYMLNKAKIPIFILHA